MTNNMTFEATITALEEEGHRRMQARIDAHVLKHKLPDALADVKLLREPKIEALEGIMPLQKVQELDTLPTQIRFVIPSRVPSPEPELKDVGLPTSHFSDPMPVDGETSYSVAHYVYTDQMPRELKNVITQYLMLVNGSDLHSYASFKDAVQKLNDQVTAMSDKAPIS